ncbi:MULTISPECIES: hypothetical protein [unclassified Nostoc]|uniref:hypothetical protein n=1 Tax=unclassified Nostoc TaxID=2593658 RepID=UPI00117D9357|nr:hypothetical protein [Nostoc sp. 'Peltigera membranacea cyanobiont' 213]
MKPSFQVSDRNLNSNNAKAKTSTVPQQFHQIVVLTVAGGAIALFLPPLLIYLRECDRSPYLYL